MRTRALVLLLAVLFLVHLAMAAAAAAACAGSPVVGCRKPLSPGKSSLMLRDRDDAKRDLLAWKWLKGDATLVTAFGDPTTTTAYDLCVYDATVGTPALVRAIAIPAAADCDGHPCWKPRTHGFKYGNKSGMPNGVVSLFLNDGDPGTAHISLKAAGANLLLPTLPFDQDPTVTIQLTNSLGECWDADYSSALRNEIGNFKAKSD
jgi:hypothetical protein